MEKVLLIVSDLTLRQLYHEILFSKRIEIVPMTDLTTAMLLLTLDEYEEFTAIIVYVAENDMETDIFMHLRQRYSSLANVKLVLLIDNKDFKPALSRLDLALAPSQLSIKEIDTKIKDFLTNYPRSNNY